MKAAQETADGAIAVLCSLAVVVVAFAIAARGSHPGSWRDLVCLLVFVVLLVAAGWLVRSSHEGFIDLIVPTWDATIFCLPLFNWLSLLFVTEDEFVQGEMTMSAAVRAQTALQYATVGVVQAVLPRSLDWQLTMLTRAIAFDAALMLFVSARKLSWLRLVIESARLELCLVFAPVLAGFVIAACTHVGIQPVQRLVAADRRLEHLLVLAPVLVGLCAAMPTRHELHSRLSLLPPPGASPPSPPPGPKSPGPDSQLGEAERLLVAHQVASCNASNLRTAPRGPQSSQAGGSLGRRSSEAGTSQVATGDARLDALALGRFRGVYTATVATARAATWEAARAALRPCVEAVVDAATSDRFEASVKQLWVLSRMHGKMEAGRGFDKLRAITDAMHEQCGMAKQVSISVHMYFERNILAYGAVEHVVSSSFVLPPTDVPALLDRYRWRHDERRHHVEHLLRMSLAAVADFRARAATAEACASVVEVEGGLHRARSRLRDAVQSALQKHGRTGAQGISAEAFAAKIEHLAEAREARALQGLEGRLSALELVSLEPEPVSSHEESGAAAAIGEATASTAAVSSAAAASSADDGLQQLPPKPPPASDDVVEETHASEATRKRKAAAMVVARARGAVEALLQAAGLNAFRVDVIGSSLLYVAQDVDLIVTTEHVDTAVVALELGPLSSVHHEPPFLTGAIDDGLQLEVQVLPVAPTDTRQLQRRSAIAFWAEVSRFAAENAGVVGFVERVQEAFATRGMKGHLLGLLPSVAVLVIALNTWLAHKRTSPDEPDVSKAFEYLRSALSFDPSRPDAPPCVRLFELAAERSGHSDTPQMGLTVLGSASSHSMTSRMSVLTTRAIYLLCTDASAFSADATTVVVPASRQLARAFVKPLLRELDRLAGDFMLVGRNDHRLPDAHSSEYVAALLLRWRGEDQLEMHVHTASERRTSQLLTIIERFTQTAAAAAAAP